MAETKRALQEVVQTRAMHLNAAAHQHGGGPGARENVQTGVSEPLFAPSRREPDDEQLREPGRTDHAVGPGLNEQRLRRDSEHPLDDERGAGEKAARVALACLGLAGRAEEAQGRLRRRGQPGGAQTSSGGGTIDLAYFGLMPHCVGHGLGRYLLTAAIEQAWSYAPERLTVNTNTMDHPRALPLYQKLGFLPYRQEEQEILDPELTGIIAG